ncbi:hypothetical protein SAMN04515647_3926 [Cohaesibacter sp. ES.047]|nr:hypothetical protein SAMN04515647_3926 [Cohaesibacter sp. ES.047]
MNDGGNAKIALVSGRNRSYEAENVRCLRSRDYHFSRRAGDATMLGNLHGMSDIVILFGRFVASDRKSAEEWGGAHALSAQIAMGVKPTGETGQFRFNRFGKTQSPKLQVAA